MKKTILFALCICSSLSLYSQRYWDSSRPNHRFTFGVRVGANFAKQYYMEDVGADNDFRTGFQAGIATDINIVRSFSLNSGVFYTQKGYKTEYSDYRGSVSSRNNAQYIEVPLLASYRVELSDAAQLQLNLGPYFAFGIAGKLDVTNTFPNGTSYSIDSFDEYDGMKKFDSGVSVGFAMTYSQIYAGISYERSLMNVSNTTEKYQNGSISMVIGYNY